jgi:anti-sigma factor (TIGR02949 family)
MKEKNIGCKEAIKHLLSFLENDLTQVQHNAVEHHLSTCRACFSRADFEKTLKEQLRKTGDESAPEELKNRVKNILGRY